MVGMEFKIVSFNVRGLNKASKRTAIFEYLRKIECDLVILQETYSSNETYYKWRQEWGGKAIFFHGTKHSKGVAILINQDMDLDIIEQDSDINNRIMFFRIRVKDNIVNIFNVYSPNKEQEQLEFLS